MVKRQTARSRLTRALKSVRSWLRQHVHEEIEDQHGALHRKLLGHYGYFGVTGNAHGLESFFYFVTRTWRYWLSRRSQRAKLSWARFKTLLRRFPLPRPRIVHSAIPSVANP